VKFLLIWTDFGLEYSGYNSQLIRV